MLLGTSLLLGEEGPESLLHYRCSAMAKCNELYRLIDGPRLAVRSQPGFRKRAMQGRRRYPAISRRFGAAKASVTLDVYGHQMEGATAKGDRKVTEIVTGANGRQRTVCSVVRGLKVRIFREK